MERALAKISVACLNIIKVTIIVVAAIFGIVEKVISILLLFLIFLRAMLVDSERKKMKQQEKANA